MTLYLAPGYLFLGGRTDGGGPGVGEAYREAIELKLTLMAGLVERVQRATMSHQVRRSFACSGKVPALFVIGLSDCLLAST